MKVHIIGGMSVPGSITIQSDRFISRATRGRDGQIRCFTTEVPKTAQWVRVISKIPIPRTLLFAIFLIPLLASFLSPSMIVAVIVVFLIPIPSSGTESGFSFLPLLLEISQISLPLLVFLFLNQVGGWHAAEHKVIAAYLSTSSTSIAEIENANRIDRKCGARFIIPFLFGSVLADPISQFLGISSLLVILVIYEALFWIDHLVGFDRIAPTWFASRLLQTYLTTREPNLGELLTAKSAMDCLIERHVCEENKVDSWNNHLLLTQPS